MAETRLDKNDFILPVFVEEEITQCVEIATMPGVFRLPESQLPAYIREVAGLGVAAVILFGVSHNKDACASDTVNQDGLVARMVRSAKTNAGDMLVFADICLCQYTDHGHCGSLTKYHGDENNIYVDNDKSIDILAKQAVIAAINGADLVAPSAMMDGMVGAIRGGLDAAGFSHIPIMSYSSKFSSSLYGPFRIAGGTSLKGSRQTYMMDYRNRREAIMESLIDEIEGADILMVKPGLHYLDIIQELRQKAYSPICAYHTSGEYAMLKFAAINGAIDENAVLLETMTALKRAGADLIITYSTLDIIALL